VIGVLLTSVAIAAAPPTPPPITRDGARSAAQLELSKAAYHRGDPSIASRVIRWVVRKFADALEAAARHSPGKGIGLLVIVVLVALAIVLITVRVGRVRRSARAPQPILGADVATASDHRSRAETFARESRWAEAVREWLRATTRELEQRGVIDPRPGRTAAELCTETSQELPGIADDVRRATSVFDAIWYGGRAATPDDEELLRRLDARVAGSHRALASSV
jgi:hypothetical protein